MADERDGRAAGDPAAGAGPGGLGGWLLRGLVMKPPCAGCGEPFLRTLRACPACGTPRDAPGAAPGAVLVRTYAGAHPDREYAADAQRLAKLGWKPDDTAYGGERAVGLGAGLLRGAGAARAPKQLTVTYTHA